jgi:2-haloacid dehalogenase
MLPRAFLFDAYGTLFDVHSVVLQGANGMPGDLQTLSAIWRQKQLEYSWQRALMGRYEDFWEITKAALYAAVAQLQIEASDSELDRLMQAYLVPSAFPDAEPVLEALKDSPKAILSNGSPKMLASMVRHNRLERYFVKLISVDTVKTYKPSPLVYALATDTLGLPAADILFVSSNSWDAAGAKAFGYRVCWCNRSVAAPEHMGFTPDLEVNGLDQIAAAL